MPDVAPLREPVPAPESLPAPEAGVWWDGVLNPMSPEGLRAALAQEDGESGFRPSDIRWVAWPGYGQKVHVSQVDELLPYWADVEYRRILHWLISTTFLMVNIAYCSYTAQERWLRDLNLVLLGPLAYQTIRMLWSRVKLLEDPKAWGRRVAGLERRRPPRS